MGAEIRLVVLVVLVVVSLLSGCRPNEPYTLIVVNESKEEITELEVSFPGVTFRPNHLRPGREKGMGLPRASIAGRIQVRWKGPRSGFNDKEVRVSPAVLQGWGGVVRIAIHEEGEVVVTREKGPLQLDVRTN